MPVGPLRVHVAVFVERNRSLRIFDQTNVSKCTGHTSTNFVAEIAFEFGATQRFSRIRQHHFEVSIFRHALNQAVGFRQAGATTEHKLDAFELQAEDRPERIRQMLVLFQQRRGDAIEA